MSAETANPDGELSGRRRPQRPLGRRRGGARVPRRAVEGAALVAVGALLAVAAVADLVSRADAQHRGATDREVYLRWQADHGVRPLPQAKAIEVRLGRRVDVACAPLPVTGARRGQAPLLACLRLGRPPDPPTVTGGLLRTRRAGRRPARYGACFGSARALRRCGGHGRP